MQAAATCVKSRTTVWRCCCVKSVHNTCVSVCVSLCARPICSLSCRCQNHVCVAHNHNCKCLSLLFRPSFFHCPPTLPTHSFFALLSSHCLPSHTLRPHFSHTFTDSFAIAGSHSQLYQHCLLCLTLYFLSLTLLTFLPSLFLSSQLSALVLSKLLASLPTMRRHLRAGYLLGDTRSDKTGSLTMNNKVGRVYKSQAGFKA